MNIEVREDDLSLGLSGLDLGYGVSGEASVFSGNPAVDRLILTLTSCGLQAIVDPSGAANCAWNALRGVIPASEDLQVTLSLVVDSSCATALAALGLPTEICSIPGVSVLWSLVQGKARLELERIVGASRSASYEENYARGRDRSATEGGGHTLVDAAGTEIAVRCPGYRKTIGHDAAGYPTYVMEPPTEVLPGTLCPRDVQEKQTGVAIVARPIVKKMPRFSLVPSDSFKSGEPEPEPETRPWYKNKWVWIGTAAVLAGGTAVVVVYTRRDGGR